MILWLLKREKKVKKNKGRKRKEKENVYCIKNLSQKTGATGTYVLGSLMSHLDHRLFYFQAVVPPVGTQKSLIYRKDQLHLYLLKPTPMKRYRTQKKGWCNLSLLSHAVEAMIYPSIRSRSRTYKNKGFSL